MVPGTGTTFIYQHLVILDHEIVIPTILKNTLKGANGILDVFSSSVL